MRKDVFSQIYSKHSWGGSSRSGPGSDPKNTRPYVKYVDRWLANHPQCRRIVEIGCGDWATTSRIQIPSGCSYIGYDIVESVVAVNQQRFGSEQIRFECVDFLESSIVTGDLLLAKDVLQHLSNDSVRQFIDSTLGMFTWAILTNDIEKFRQRTVLGFPLRRLECDAPNVDIADGSSRPLSLSEPPFCLQPYDTQRYRNVLRSSHVRSVFVKEIFVWSCIQNAAHQEVSSQ